MGSWIHIVHHIARHPKETAKGINVFCFSPVASFYWLLRLAEKICFTTLSTKGIQIRNRHYQLLRRLSAKGGILLKEDGVFFLSPCQNNFMCLLPTPQYFLYIFIYMQINNGAIWEQPPVLLKTAALGIHRKTVATGACNSWICSYDIWNSSADFSTPFFIDTNSLPITRVFK